MKRFFTLILSVLAIASCVDDKSGELYPENNPNFSFISITSPLDTMSVELGQAVSFTPTVTQKFDNGDMTYSWTANKIGDGDVLGEEMEIGSEPTLNYTFVDGGFYKVKLLVTNASYTESKSWVMQVRTYDAGFFIASNDVNSGESVISFARDLSATDIMNGLQLTFAKDLIANVNPEYEIKDVVRICKSILSYGSTEAYLFIFTKKVIYVADPETFRIFVAVNVNDFLPGEDIVQVAVADTYMTTAYLLTSLGRVVGFNKTEFGVYGISTDNLSTFYSSQYYVDLFYSSYGNLSDSRFWVDPATSKIYSCIDYFSYGGGTNPATSTMDKVGGVFVDDAKPNVFDGYNIETIFRMNGDGYQGQNSDVFALGQSKTVAGHYKLFQFNTLYTAGFVTTSVKEFDSPSASYKSGTILVPNGRYTSAYYADGSDVYIWYPTNLATQLPFSTIPALSLGGGKEITFMRVSYDMRDLYVGFYDSASSEELKGGFYVYDASQIGVTQGLQPYYKFENVCKSPVDIIHKTLGWDQYNSL